jgi:hypothetical protein
LDLAGFRGEAAGMKNEKLKMARRLRALLQMEGLPETPNTKHQTPNTKHQTLNAGGWDSRCYIS